VFGMTSVAVFSLLVLAIIAVLLLCLSDYFRSRPPKPSWATWLKGLNAETVAQIVPSVVVAIFVFAVGTAFVVAQIVPPARGTRATATLQGRRMFWTIGPAPALIIGSVLAVLGRGRLAGAISVAILIGAIAYLLVALAVMLTLLLDATDPSRFRALLLKKADRAIERQAKHRPPGGDPTASKPWERVPPLLDPKVATIKSIKAWQRQRATDDLYAVVRTARGWARVAAQTNDSRELLESLRGILQLIDSYASKVLAKGTVDTVPSTYRPDDLLNPSRKERRSGGGQDGEIDPDYVPWAPPPLFNPEQTSMSWSLPSTWLANEIGRAVVRAIELGIGANSLLDRDMRRLLNTLVIAASRFDEEALKLEDPTADARADADLGLSAEVLTWNAGVMIRYLVEVGLGVRHSPTDMVDWYREPAVQLALLQRKFGERFAPLEGEFDAQEKELEKANLSGLDEKKKQRDKKSKELARANALATGAAAGVLLVAASLITARGRQDDVPRCWWEGQDFWDEKDHGASHDVPRAIVDAAGGLELTDEQVDKAAPLAFGPVFEPGERLIVDQPEAALRTSLLDELRV
jgi:hypothetical protein